jgi:hypothetical protein
MTSSPPRYADNARAAMKALMLSVMREGAGDAGEGGFASVAEVQATLEDFDRIAQAMWFVLPSLEARVRDDFDAGRAHRDLSAAAVAQFGLQHEQARLALRTLMTHIAWMTSIVTFYGPARP